MTYSENGWLLICCKCFVVEIVGDIIALTAPFILEALKLPKKRSERIYILLSNNMHSVIKTFYLYISNTFVILPLNRLFAMATVYFIPNTNCQIVFIYKCSFISVFVRCILCWFLSVASKLFWWRIISTFTLS